MKVTLKIDDHFHLNIENGDEKATLELLQNLVGAFVRFGVQEGAAKVAEILETHYRGQPGWKFTEKSE